MTYMTYVHWLTVIFFILALVVAILIIRKSDEKKLIIPMLFSATLIISFTGMFTVYVLDLYLKKAQITKLTTKRIYVNETMLIRGFVKNTGSFKIGKATLWVKMANKGLSLSRLKGSDVYNPNNAIIETILSIFDAGKKDKRPIKSSTIEKEFVIATNLKPGRTKSFIIRMKYPAHFKRPSFFTKVYAH